MRLPRSVAIFGIVFFVSRPVVDRGIVCHQFEIVFVYFNCILLSTQRERVCNLSGVGFISF